MACHCIVVLQTVVDMKNWLLTLFYENQHNKFELNNDHVILNWHWKQFMHISFVTHLFWHFCKYSFISYGKTIFTSEVAILSHNRKTIEKLANFSFNPLPIRDISEKFSLMWRVMSGLSNWLMVSVYYKVVLVFHF